MEKFIELAKLDDLEKLFQSQRIRKSGVLGNSILTHCGLVTAYSDIILGQHWPR